jgi:hypothetical protein
MRTLALLALAGCSSSSPSPPQVARAPVAVLSPVPNNKVDVLFMIDDSVSSQQYRQNVADNVPAFIDRLSRRGQLPDLHIGRISSDLGTSAASDQPPAPQLGTGPSACAGSGANGELQIYDAQIQGRYITDRPNSDGTREINYLGALSDVISTLIRGGSETCGFEQHLEAVHRALTNQAENAGFVRPEANLAVILVGDEDDCSIADTAFFGTDSVTLGPVLSFRCTRFGITCDQGGATPDDMNQIGAKAACHSNEASEYLTRVADTKDFLDSLKPDPLMVAVGAIVGDPEPVAVDLLEPPGGGTPNPHLAHSCQYPDASNPTIVGDPAVRDVELANQFDRHTVGTICQQDLSGPLVDIARQIDSMTGSPCLFRDIADPQDCVASDDDGPVAACSGDSSTDCYVLVTDEATCPEGQHLRVDVHGTLASKLTLSCKLP